MDSIAERIRAIREGLGLGRTEFARVLGVSRQTIENIERAHQRAREDVILGIAEHWPQYAYWLVTGKEQATVGNISPETDQTLRAGQPPQQDAA